MAQISKPRFYLNPPDSEGKRLIVLQFRYTRAGKKERVTFSVGQHINPGKQNKKGEFENWDIHKQRVKNRRHMTEDGDSYLNDVLDALERECLSCYKQNLKNGIPEPEIIRNHLAIFMNRAQAVEDKPTLFGLIERFIAGEIRDARGKKKSYATILSYKVAYNHLQAFGLINKTRVDFETIDLGFYHKYVNFLENPAKVKTISFEYDRKEGLSPNSVGNQIKILKSFMNEAVDQKLTSNVEFRSKKFVKPSQPTDSVYLTEEEIIRLYRYDLSPNRRLEQARDLFVFGCFVGLRYSDYSTVKPENIIQSSGEYFIRMITRKTGERVVIPCNPVVLEIFRKYDSSPNKLPKALSNQKFNDYVKEACKEAGFAEIGRLLTKPDLPLYEAVSSHTARRSFATSYYLQGFPTIDLMKITGHKTEVSFLKYVKVSKEQSALRLSEHIKKNWSEKVLRVVA